jgi:hypothetical protein
MISPRAELRDKGNHGFARISRIRLELEDSGIRGLRGYFLGKKQEAEDESRRQPRICTESTDKVWA